MDRITTPAPRPWALVDTRGPGGRASLDRSLTGASRTSGDRRSCPRGHPRQWSGNVAFSTRMFAIAFLSFSTAWRPYRATVRCADASTCHVIVMSLFPFLVLISPVTRDTDVRLLLVTPGSSPRCGEIAQARGTVSAPSADDRVAPRCEHARRTSAAGGRVLAHGVSLAERGSRGDGRGATSSVVAEVTTVMSIAHSVDRVLVDLIRSTARETSELP